MKMAQKATKGINLHESETDLLISTVNSRNMPVARNPKALHLVQVQFEHNYSLKGAFSPVLDLSGTQEGLT